MSGQAARLGFTLAEVLITLGIIGVVAALTIPALMVKHQKKVFATKVKQTYSIVSNALLSSVAENGAPNTWAYYELDSSDPDYFNKASSHMEEMVVKYFKPYFKIIGEGKNAPGYYLILSNGVTLYFQPDVYATSNGTYKQSSVFILGSTVGNRDYFVSADRNYSRTDFLIQIRATDGNAKVQMYMTDYTLDEIKNHSKYGCNKNISPNYRIGCGAMIQKNNWEIPDDYPW